MNQRNVEALTLLLASFRTDDGATVCRAAPASIAELLASFGVLVPSAITDEQARAMDDENRPDSGPALRDALKRIAKGEP